MPITLSRGKMLVGGLLTAVIISSAAASPASASTVHWEAVWPKGLCVPITNSYNPMLGLGACFRSKTDLDNFMIDVGFGAIFGRAGGIGGMAAGGAGVGLNDLYKHVNADTARITTCTVAVVQACTWPFNLY